MGRRQFIQFQLCFWLAAAGLLFLYGLSYGHAHIAAFRAGYIFVLSVLLSSGISLALRQPAFSDERLAYAGAVLFSGLAAVLTAVAVNPVTFGLADSPSVSRLDRILSMDTLYFALFFCLWSLLFLRLDRYYLGSLQSLPAGGEGEFLVELPVSLAGEQRKLKVHDLEALLAEGDYVNLIAGDRSYLISGSLGARLKQLDPEAFVRVHRSVAVNIHHVAVVRPLGRGTFEIELTSGEKVHSSRSYKEAILDLLPNG